MDTRDPEAGGDGAGHDLYLRELIPRLAQLSNALNRGRLTERAIEAAGIAVDRPAMTALLVLHVADAPLRIGEIAARMQVVGPHVTRQVNELERRGLVRRVTDPDDQRARLVEPTAQGQELTDRYLRAVFGWFGEALAGWPEEDRRAFERLLGRFVDDLTVHLATLDDDAT
ncbi:MarR family winged helix-turn-helix transcriptional regulator [Actinomadura terrae]|uniref:MarR family winged helix-turn-helix transcriptional regulator n=1 Tax=Actinomadura terrae TaxID=604353 RepID=UPI001FA77655|nr:MarR family transcriptional regulator [Actinomadura terrae]